MPLSSSKNNYISSLDESESELKKNRVEKDDLISKSETLSKELAQIKTELNESIATNKALMKKREEDLDNLKLR